MPLGAEGDAWRRGVRPIDCQRQRCEPDVGAASAREESAIRAANWRGTRAVIRQFWQRAFCCAVRWRGRSRGGPMTLAMSPGSGILHVSGATLDAPVLPSRCGFARNRRAVWLGRRFLRRVHLHNMLKRTREDPR